MSDFAEKYADELQARRELQATQESARVGIEAEQAERVALQERQAQAAQARRAQSYVVHPSVEG
jgi:hypothetical protein